MKPSIVVLLVLGVALAGCEPRMPQKPKTAAVAVAAAWNDAVSLMR